MADRLIHCRVCGKEYKVCPACKRTGGWNLLTDTEDHYRILVSLMDYQADRDAVKARTKLEIYGVDFMNIKPYIPSVVKLIKEIGDATSLVEDTDDTIVEDDE